jgi:hypothetical protein
MSIVLACTGWAKRWVNLPYRPTEPRAKVSRFPWAKIRQEAMACPSGILAWAIVSLLSGGASSSAGLATQRLAAQHVISQSSVVPPRAFEALPLTAATIGAPAHRPLLIPVAVIVGLALAAWSRRDWISSSGIEDDDWRRLLLGLAFGYRLWRRLVPRLRIALECQAWLWRLLLAFGSGVRRRRRLPGS